MNAEETIREYEHLIPITLQKMFGDVDRYAKSKGLERDDLYQFAFLGIHNAIQTYPEKECGKLRNYIIRNIKWSVNRWVVKDQLNQSIYKFYHKKEQNRKVSLLSMSNKPFDDQEIEFYDIIATDNIYNFETEVVASKLLAKESFKNIWNLLNDREKEMIVMKANGMTYTEIGKHYGVIKQAIGQRFKTIQNKVKRHMGVAQ